MKQRIKRNISATMVVMLFLSTVIFSCGRDNPVPKPRGYFRIDLPERNYRIFDTNFPYRFEYPVYTRISGDPHAPEEPYWINVDFPRFAGRLHLSYKEVNDTNLVHYLEDSRNFVMKHIPKATSINDSLIMDREKEKFGLVYEIYGPGVASPYQFFLTDSARHFLRGALYFNVVPNNDSLRPVIDFIHKDIIHLIRTFEWTE